MSLNLDVGVKGSSLQELERLAQALRSVDASLASLGKGNPMGVDSVNQQLTRMRRESAVAIQGIRNDLAEIAALSTKKATQIEKSAEEVAKAQERAAAKESAAVEKRMNTQRRTDNMFAEAQARNASGIDKYTASMMVGSAKIVETQEKAAAREAAAASKRQAQLMVGSAKIAEAQELAIAREEAARSKWQARMQVGSAKIAEAHERAAAREAAAAEKLANQQRRATATFERSQEEAAARHETAVNRRLNAQRRADAMFEAAQVKAEADRARAAAGAAGLAAAPSVTVSGGGSGRLRVPDGPDVPKLKALTAAMNDAHSAARGLASGFNAMFLTWGNLVPLLAGAVVSNAFVQTIKLGAEVSNTFAVIKNLSEETSTAVAGLNSQMLELARNGPFGPREVAEAMKTLSLAGLNAQEVGSSIKDVLNFAVAGDTSIKIAADVMSSVATAFKISADGYNYVGDVIAKTAAVSKSSVESIGESFKTASVINSQYGASLEDVGTGLALLSNLGIQGTAAGTALRNMYVDLLGRTPKVEKALKELGVSAIDPLTGKARDLVSIMSDLNAGLAKFTPTAGTKLFGDVFSERGGKPAVAALDALRAKAKEAGVTVASYLEEMRQKIQDSAGFMAIAAANMAMTPLNQMKSVVASFQATMVEAFDGLQPYIVSMSQQLKDVFASEDFKQGLKDLVIGVAEVTKFLVEHAGAIVTVVGAYAALKVAMAVGALMQAGAVAAAAYSASLGTVASSQIAVASASVLAGRGVATLTAGMTAAATIGSTVMAGVSGLMTLLARLSPWILAAVSAWQLYSFWTDKSAKSNADYSGDTHKAYISSLQAETQRIQDLVAAKRENVSVDELQRRRQSAKEASSEADQIAQAQAKVAKAEKALAGLSVGGPMTNLTAYNASRTRAEDAVKTAKTDYDNARNEANMRYAQRQLEESRLKAAADNLRREEAAAAKARQDALPSGTRTVGGGKPGKDGAGAGAGAGAGPDIFDRNPFNGIESVYKADEKALKQYLSTESKLLNARRSEELINEGEYQASLLMLTSESEAKQLDVLKTRATAADSANTAEIARIKAQKSTSELEGRRLDELKQKYDGIVASVKAETEAVKLQIKERQDLATIRSRGELAKLDKQTSDFWAKDQTELDSAKALEAAKERLRYASTEEVAAFEASTAAQAKYARESVKIRTALDHAVESQEAFNNTLMSGTSITPEMVAKAEELGVTVEQLTARWKDFNATAESRAAEAGMDAANRVLRDKARAMTNELADGIVDGLMNGGKAGGKALRSWLMKYFVQEPLTIAVRGVLSNVAGGAFNMLLGGGGGGGSGGGAGGSGGGLLGMASNASSLYSAATGNGFIGNAMNTVGGWLGMGGAGAAGATGLGLTAATGAGTTLAATGSGLGLSLGGSGLGLSAGSGALGAGLGTSSAAIGGAAGGAAAGGAGLMGGLSSAVAAIPVWGWALAAVAALGSMLSKKQTLHSGAGAIYSSDKGLQEGAGIYNLNTFGMGDVREYNKDGQQLASGIAQGLASALDGVATSFGRTAGFEVATAFADDTSKDGAWGSLRISQGGKDLLDWNDTRSSKWAPREFGDGEAGQREYLALAAQDARKLLLDMDLPGWAEDMLNSIGELTNMDQLAGVVGQISQVQTAFQAFGQYMPTFATLADTAKTLLVQASGGVAALAANMGTFVDNFYSDAEKLAVNTQKVKDEMAKLGFEMPKTREEFRDLVEAQIALGDAGAKTLAGLLGLSGAFASVTAATVDATAAAEELANKQRERLDSAYSALERAVSAEKERIQAQLQDAQDLANRLQSIFDVLHRNVRELRGEVEASRIAQVQQGNDFITKALSVAKSTGALPDLDKLTEAISDARSGLDVSNYGGDTAERDYAALVLAGKLSGLEEITGKQLTDAQRAVKLLQQQSDQLDDILDYWSQQIAISTGTYEGILSLTDAINNMQETIKNPNGKPNTVGGGTTPGSGGGAVSRVNYGADEALTSFDKFKAWYNGIRGTADASKFMDSGYQVPDWMRVHNGADDGTDKEMFGSYLFFKNNPQYAKDFEQIYNTGRSSYATDGSTLVKSDISKMPTEVADFFKGNRDALLGYEQMGLDPVLAYQLYNYGPQQFGLDKGKESFTEWLQTHKWTADGIVKNNNVVSFAAEGYKNYNLSRWNTTDGTIIDLDGKIYTTEGKVVGRATREQMESVYGAGIASMYKPGSSLYNSQVGGGRSEADYYGDIKTNIDKAIADGKSAQWLADSIRDTGASLQDVANAYGIPVQQVVDNLKAGGATSIPGFAKGGLHAGGLRVVGERSWEIEATGPSRIWTPEQMASAMGGTDARVAELLSRLIAEVSLLRAANDKTANSSTRTADALDKVTNGNKLMTGAVDNW